MWAPRPFRSFCWSDEYFEAVARDCDQLAVMGYDSGVWWPRGYTWLVHQQVVHVTQAVERGNPRCRVLFGVPTYGRGGLSHFPRAENLWLALKGIREGVADPALAAGSLRGRGALRRVRHLAGRVGYLRVAVARTLTET
jgi:hypothetical protein